MSFRASPVFALCRQGHIALHRDVGRTGGFARRGPAPFDGVRPRNPLGVLAVCRAANVQALVMQQSLQIPAIIEAEGVMKAAAVVIE